jgi:hypothetical protein
VSALVRCFSLDDRSPDVLRSTMPRSSRIEFEEAIDHVMARRNARQKIFRDDAARRRLIDGLPHEMTQPICRARQVCSYAASRLSATTKVSVSQMYGGGND